MNAPPRRLSDAYRRAVQARAGSARRGCPSPEDLQSLVDRKDSDEKRLAVLDHVMVCPACARDFELLRAVEESAPVRHAIAPWATVLAATLVFAIGIVWYTRGRHPVSAEDRVRGARDAVAVVGAVRTSGAPRLVWQAVPSAIRYEVEVLDARGEPVFIATVRDTTAVLSDSLIASATPAWRWWVRAHLADGTTRESPRASLRK